MARFSHGIRIVLRRLRLPAGILLLMLAPAGLGMAQGSCLLASIAQQPSGYPAGGLILTAFDRDAIWVYDVASGRRYPLPETSPCAGNCHLSADGRWLAYFNDATNAFNRMRLDGTERSVLAPYAADVAWWPDEALLVWTTARRARVQDAGGSALRELDTGAISDLQPGGAWAVVLVASAGGFTRVLTPTDINDSAGRIILGEDIPYFDAASWSPDGSQYAFAAPVMNSGGGVISTELYVVAPGRQSIRRLTDLTRDAGPVRINGLSAGELSWSPDGTRIAFWTLPLQNGSAVPDQPATLRIIDVNTSQMQSFCGMPVYETTPNPPALRWSPDGSAVAFVGNVPEDERGYLLLALNAGSGALTELSEGVYPALGKADVYAWGLPP